MTSQKGNYIAFIDADDQWIKNKIEEQLSFMISGNIDFSHTSYKIIDEENKYISSRKAKFFSYKDLIKSCDIGLSTVMFKGNS